MTGSQSQSYRLMQGVKRRVLFVRKHARQTALPQKSKSSEMIWLAGFTELFNWLLSPNSTDSQLPVWKGWIFPLADDTGAKQQEPVVLSVGKKNHPTHPSTKTSHISAAPVLPYNLDNRGCHVEETPRHIHLSEPVFACHDGERGPRWEPSARVIIEVQTRTCEWRLQNPSPALGGPARTTLCLCCSALTLAAAACLTIEGQHSVMSRITKGDWQE